MTNPDIVKKAISTFRVHINRDKPPFLKTCTECNAPMRANDHIVSVVMRSFNSTDFTDIEYFCINHTPNANDVTDELLTGYAVILRMRIVEDAPDCEPEDRSIEIIDSSFSRPSSYDI